MINFQVIEGESKIKEYLQSLESQQSIQLVEQIEQLEISS